MELKEIAENVYYIPTPTNIGVIQDGRMAILIDSGLDDDTGRQILRALEERGLHPEAIMNTHAHADHCGANAYIKEKSGALIYAPEIEASIIQEPFLEPLYLFSGASPIESLRNKFLMARPSQVDYVIKGEKRISFDKVEIGIVQLPGHSPNQIGIQIEDILFCADSVFSTEVLSRHKIPFCTDIGKQRETLSFLRDSSYKIYVPCHAEPTNTIVDLVDPYLQIIGNVEDFLAGTLRSKKTTEQILKALCDFCKIEIKGTQQYYLANTITLAFLSYLHRKGVLKLDIRGNLLHWVT